MKPNNRWIVLILAFFCAFLPEASSQRMVDVFAHDLSSWYGDTAAFTLDEGVLQSQSNRSNASVAITRQYSSVSSMIWDLTVRLPFATSSANYVDWVLQASRSEITQDYQGYYVRIGDKEDRIALYYRNAEGTKLMCTSKSGITHHAAFRIRCTFHNGQWVLTMHNQKKHQLERIEQRVPYAIDTGVFWTGLLVRQSSKSFHKKHFFEDYFITPYTADTTGPQLVTSRVLDSVNVTLQFDEQLVVSQVEVRLNQRPIYAQNEVGKTALTLQLGAPLKPGWNALEVNGLRDISGNLTIQRFQLFYKPPRLPEAFEVVVSELMVDPDPPVQMPKAEYVELYNRSIDTFNLKYLTLSVNGKRVRLPDFQLRPSAYVVLSQGQAYEALLDSSRLLSLDYMPALTNTSGHIDLMTYDGQRVHEVRYQNSQHTEAWKKSGGWSLEMKDIRQPCILLNWASSQHAKGGSPGQPNAGHDAAVDTTPPKVLSTVVKAYRIGIGFGEVLSAYHPILQDVRLNPSQQVIDFLAVNDTLWLFFERRLEKNTVYDLFLSNIHDCSGNMLDTMLRIAYFDREEAPNFVISEVMFDTDDDLPDFIELTNVGQRVATTEGLVLNRMSNGVPLDYVVLPDAVLKPDESVVFVGSQKSRLNSRPMVRPANVVETALFNLPQNGLDLHLCEPTGNVLDAARLRSSYHNPWLTNHKNVSLERITAHHSGMDSNNWRSASGPLFATPTRAVFDQATEDGTTMLKVRPDPISPNQDGVDDYARLMIRPPQNSLVDLYVCDLYGRVYRQMLNRSPMEHEVTLDWYGLGEQGVVLPEGIYVLVLRCTTPTNEYVTRKPITVRYAGGF